jgi:rfaE bifunctional protein nucleotidyltransferase chain/domain
MRSFVNGCFDVLHVGHIRLLKFAAMFGELTVGLNSDLSIQQLKGDSRPINCEADRREILMSLSVVRDVVTFHYKEPSVMLNTLYRCGRGPDVVVKGEEYANREIPEREIIELNGGKIVFFPHQDGYSSTRILDALHFDRW